MKLIRIETGGANIFYPVNQLLRVIVMSKMVELRFSEQPSRYYINHEIAEKLIDWLTLGEEHKVLWNVFTILQSDRAEN